MVEKVEHSINHYRTTRSILSQGESWLWWTNFSVPISTQEWRQTKTRCVDQGRYWLHFICGSMHAQMSLCEGVLACVRWNAFFGDFSCL